MSAAVEMYAPSFFLNGNYFKVLVHSRGKNAKITWLDGPLKGRHATLESHTLKKTKP